LKFIIFYMQSTILLTITSPHHTRDLQLDSHIISFYTRSTHNNAIILVWFNHTTVAKQKKGLNSTQDR